MPRRMLITAGPTHEPIDEVRYIANRSSGKMGVAIAEAARDAGWEVTLLLGQISIPPPLPRGAEGDQGGSPKRGSLPPTGSRASPTNEITTLRFTTTEDLRALLAEHFPQCDVLVMAAAVADYRPMKSAAGKIERGETRLTLDLEPTPDLVAECAKRKRSGQFIVGFSLEGPAKLRDRALEKLKRKGLDAIVANPLRTMGDDAVDPVLYFVQEREVAIARPSALPMKKRDFAKWLVEYIAQAAAGTTQSGER